ncbi:hypothetical protein FLCU109888_02860 [Flavobacterium cucumis]|uniref:Lipoprotein n=1 Tax=Flavobacterium cucumis TaxID=416016 RepID=A0A1M7ZUH7_9FLAO|nr:hypothetical protein [Flavobacterium cucumis]SHO72534.1 hypothetical protein SAMN05443547_0868 [Flavobacterium cucumis]
MNNVIFKLVFLLACVLVAFAINSCSHDEEYVNANLKATQIDYQNVMKHREIAKSILSSEQYEDYISSAIALYENLNFSYNNEELGGLKTVRQLQDWMAKNWKNTNFNSISEFESALIEFKIHQEEFTVFYGRNLVTNSNASYRDSFKNMVLSLLQKKDLQENQKISLSGCGEQALVNIKEAKNKAIVSLMVLNATNDKDQDLEGLFAIFLLYNQAVSESSDALNACFRLEQIAQ